MTGILSPFERALLAELVESGDQPPAGLMLALDEKLDAVLDTVADLHERGMLSRDGFSTCRVTDRGRAALERE